MTQTLPNYLVRSPLPNEPKDPAAYSQFEITLHLHRSELGKFVLKGNIHARVQYEHGHSGRGRGYELAMGLSPPSQNPDNATANAALAKEAAFQQKVTVHPQASCRLERPPYPYFLEERRARRRPPPMFWRR